MGNLMKNNLQKKTVVKKTIEQEESTGNAKEMLIVKANKEFYVDGYRRSLLIIVILGVALVISILGNLMLINKDVKVQNFAVFPDGRTVPLSPVNEPLVNENFIREFTSRALMDVFQLDFNHYIPLMNRNQSYFTVKGFNSFEEVMAKGIKPILEDNHMNSTAVPTANPSIIRQGELQGTYVWELKVPFVLTFEGTKGKIVKNFVATITVTRVPQTLRTAGVAISGITLEEGKR